jgi:citrate synthase
MSGKVWKTAITDIGPGRIRVRGYDIADIMEKLDFAEAVFLIFKGELPDKSESRMMRAILTSSIDHGCSPPSTLGARNIIAGGNPLNAAIAGGVLAIGDSHGGAIERCARILQEYAQRKGEIVAIAAQLVDDLIARGERMPGFGHYLHKRDPRSAKLFEIAKKNNFWGKHTELCLQIEAALAAKTGRELPVNINGATAAVISDMGFDWRLGKAFFIISRVPGLAAHAYEEMIREKPMRPMGRNDYIYDGPKDRGF